MYQAANLPPKMLVCLDPKTQTKLLPFVQGIDVQSFPHVQDNDVMDFVLIDEYGFCTHWKEVQKQIKRTDTKLPPIIWYSEKMHNDKMLRYMERIARRNEIPFTPCFKENQISPLMVGLSVMYCPKIIPNMLPKNDPKKRDYLSLIDTVFFQLTNTGIISFLRSKAGKQRHPDCTRLLDVEDKIVKQEAESYFYRLHKNTVVNILTLGDVIRADDANFKWEHNGKKYKLSFTLNGTTHVLEIPYEKKGEFAKLLNLDAKTGNFLCLLLPIIGINFELIAEWLNFVQKVTPFDKTAA